MRLFRALNNKHLSFDKVLCTKQLHNSIQYLSPFSDTIPTDLQTHVDSESIVLTATKHFHIHCSLEPWAESVLKLCIRAPIILHSINALQKGNEICVLTSEYIVMGSLSETWLEVVLA